jgi:hypothetical protein
MYVFNNNISIIKSLNSGSSTSITRLNDLYHEEFQVYIVFIFLNHTKHTN